MKKRILSLWLALCIMMSLIVALPVTTSAASGGKCGDNVYWSLDNSGTLTISGSGDMYNYTYSSYVPWYNSRSSIKKAVIKSGVTTIGDNAFSSCRSLTSVTIPNSVTTIGNAAFYDCNSLTSVTIPNSVTSIGKHAFYDCNSLTSVTIPDSVTSIGNFAFFYCDSLTSVTIPNSVTSIGHCAFFYCDSLKIIRGAANNPNYSSLNGNLYDKNKTQLIQYAIGKKDTSFIIPNSVTSIGELAFSHCDSLTSVTIPHSVTTIGDDAFSFCRSLTSVTIPDSVTTIGSGAFSHCDSLTSVTIPNSVTTIGNYAFFYCSNLKDVYYSGTKEQWSKINIGSNNSPLTSATIHCNSTGPGIKSGNSKPYSSSSNTSGNGTITLVSTSGTSKSYYNNTVKNNSSITGDYTIKDADVTVANGKSLNISGKLTVENGTLYIEKGGKVTAQSIEIKTKGRVSVDGELSASGEITAKCGSNNNNGGCIEIGQNGTVSTGNVSLYDYATIILYGKLYANSFLIKTKTNLSSFGSKGEMWLKGDFTQQKSGALWWQSGADNFCPSSGFSLLLENNGRTHNISFDTPGQSYLYNLYSVTDGNTTAVWEGNPHYKGKSANVRKTSSGYTINQKDNAGSAAAAKDFKSELEAIINGKSAVKISYGISEFGGMFSETNKALEKYLYAYTSGVEALYPSVIDISVHTWSETMQVYYNGKYRKVKFTFEITNLFGNNVINVKYSYGDTQNRQCFAFLIGNKNGLANTIRKYATDTYNSAIAKCLLIDNIDKYVQNKKSNLADLLWQGVQNISVVGTASGKKTVTSVVKKGLNEYLKKVEEAIGTSAYSTDMPAVFSLDSTFAAYNSDIVPFSESAATENSESESGEAENTENGTAEALDVSDTFTDTYLISAIKKELDLEADEELTQEKLEAVEELNLSSSYITDLSGIGQCKNLKSLDLSGNAVSDLTPISKLADLQSIDLNGNSVSDLTPIANLTNLQSLSLKNNLLTSLSGLENLTELTDLDVAFNTIGDISPLQGLENIQRLNITSNNISDISPLANCRALIELYASSNEISDISALSDMTLEKLNVAQNAVSSIECINVTELSGLDISENDISDISPLTDATKLVDLNIGGNVVSDISAVAEKPMLAKLNISDNAISDISCLAQLSSLNELHCGSNNITDFDVLADLVVLSALDISNNDVEDISFISSLVNLQRLTASNCELYTEDMDAIPKNIITLDVSSNSITDIEPFVNMNSLTELNLSDNYISDITGFSAVTHDMSLNVNGNEVSADNLEALESAMQNTDYSITVTNTTPPVALQNMYFMKDTAEVKTGDEFLQQISVMPYNADSSALIWESSNTDVAEVEKGIVKGKIPGQTTITAKTADGELSAGYNLTVVDDMIQKVSVKENTVSVGVKNISAVNYASVSLIVGVYGSYDDPIDIKTVPINAFASGYVNNDIQIPFDNIPANSHIKVFLWDSFTSLEPLCSGRELAADK